MIIGLTIYDCNLKSTARSVHRNGLPFCIRLLERLRGHTILSCVLVLKDLAYSLLPPCWLRSPAKRSLFFWEPGSFCSTRYPCRGVSVSLTTTLIVLRLTFLMFVSKLISDRSNRTSVFLSEANACLLRKFYEG